MYVLVMDRVIADKEIDLYVPTYESLEKLINKQVMYIYLTIYIYTL